MAIRLLEKGWEEALEFGEELRGLLLEFDITLLVFGIHCSVRAGACSKV